MKKNDAKIYENENKIELTSIRHSRSCCCRCCFFFSLMPQINIESTSRQFITIMDEMGERKNQVEELIVIGISEPRNTFRKMPLQITRSLSTLKSLINVRALNAKY